MLQGHVVELHQLYKTFQNSSVKVSLYHGLTATIEPGELAVVSGAIGSGKTTLLNMMAGFDKPTKGAITVLGKDLQVMSEAERAELRSKEMSVLFQNENLIPNLTVEENIILASAIQSGDDCIEERAHRLLDMLGLRGKLNAHPPDLSSGEHRKVTLVRTLSRPASIMLLDEPAEKMDQSAMNIIASFLKGLHQIDNTTIIVASNHPKIAGIASQQIQLGKASVKQEGGGC